jgi:hypothetical protein
VGIVQRSRFKVQSWIGGYVDRNRSSFHVPRSSFGVGGALQGEGSRLKVRVFFHISVIGTMKG